MNILGRRGDIMIEIAVYLSNPIDQQEVIHSINLFKELTNHHVRYIVYEKWNESIPCDILILDEKTYEYEMTQVAYVILITDEYFKYASVHVQVLRSLLKESLILRLKQVVDSISLDKKTVIIDDNGLYKVRVSDIVYIEVRNRIVELGTLTMTYSSTDSFQQWKERLEMDYFVECYRGILVNMTYVTKIVNQELFLTNGKRFPVSRRKQNFVMDQFVRITNQ